MKFLRGLGLALLYFGVFFLCMVFTAMAFAQGWRFALGLLYLIWMAYFLCILLRAEFLRRTVLAAFVGYATGVLREADRFATPEFTELVSGLPDKWVGAVGVAFFFVFVALLPWLATALAERTRARWQALRDWLGARRQGRVSAEAGAQAESSARTRPAER